MRTKKQFKIKARKPNDIKFGDFVITKVDLDNNTALATFGNNAQADINIEHIVPQLTSYSKTRKTFYVRVV